MKILNYTFKPINCTCGLEFQPDITDLKRERTGYKMVGDTLVPISNAETLVVICPLCGTKHEVPAEIPQETKKYIPFSSAVGWFR